MGGGNKGKSKSTTKLPWEFRQAYTESLGKARDAASKPYEAYAGTLVAGLNPMQEQGLSNINAAYGYAQPYIQRGLELSNEAAQGITPELYNRFYSPYVRDVANTTMANMMESNAQQLSGLKGGAIQAGAFGGDRSGIAAAELARQQNLALGQTMSGIYNQGYGQAMGLAGGQVQNLGQMGQQIAGLGVGAQGAMLQGAQAQLAGGAQQQATEQAKLTAAYDQFLQKQAYPYQQAQFFANIAQGLGSTAGGTTTSTPAAPNIASQIMGGIGALGSIASISDERAKENIEPVGKMYDGQTIYRYNYKGDPETRIGLIAQEVEGHHPEAIRGLGGLKGVDYREATEDAASMGDAVHEGLGRVGFADGGIPFFPYGEAPKTWVPEGKMMSAGSSRFPEPPPPPKDDEMNALKPLDSNQVAGLGQMAFNLGIPLPGNHVNQNRGGRVGLAAGGIPTEDEVASYIRARSQAKGIDPDTALKVWSAEGRSGDPNEAWRARSILKNGKRESSYGPFQLNIEGGVGAQMIKDTGLSPADIRNWKASVDYALDTAKKGGWGPWMGAARIGLAPRAGLGGAPAEAAVTRGGVSPGPVIVPASDEAPASSNGPEVPDMTSMTRPPVTTETGGGLSRFFASNENPSIIESIMGRRMSPEARNAILTASLSMLGGRSPYFGVNVGNGAKAGMETYYNALGQKAGMIKTQADLARQAYEAKTGRIGAQAPLIPMAQSVFQAITAWKSDPRNEGQPLPDYFQQQLEILRQAGLGNGPIVSGVTGNAPDAGSDTITTAPLPAPGGKAAEAAAPGPAPLPPPDNTESIVPPGSSAAASGKPDGKPAPTMDANYFDSIYGPKDQRNPYFFFRRANERQAAGLLEGAEKDRETGQKMLDSISTNKTMVSPSGEIIPAPGALDTAAKVERVQKGAEYDAKNAGDMATSMIYAPLQNYAKSYNTIQQAANVLQDFKSGSLSEIKSQIAGLGEALGIPIDTRTLDDAANYQKFTKLMIGGLLDSGLRDKLGNVALGELELALKSTANAENQPSANRSILGTYKGVLEWQKARAVALQDYIKSKGGISSVDPLEMQTISSQWDQRLPQFVEMAKAQTPVKGELNFKDPSSRRKAKKGWQYMMDDGSIGTYNGNGGFEVN